MASITSQTFDAPDATYDQGEPITFTVVYVADSPSSVPVPFSATTVITNAAGEQVATLAAPFTVNTPQPAGDVVSTTDSGSREWTPVSDDGSTAVTTTTA
jgi:hypothetical protein